MRTNFRTCVLVAAQFLFAANLMAQSARLSGLVTDASGARVPGATIVVTNTATGIARQTLSNESGLYVFEALGPGVYDVTCELPGFKKYVSSANTLTVGQQAELNIRLDPGNVTETVSITETIAAVQTSDAQVRTVISGVLIREIPLNGRNPLHLILTGAPGVSGRGTNIVINGQKTQSFNTTVDGVDANDATLGRAELSLVPINPDTVQEYQLITSNFKAEYGRSSGAQVSVITRSGTNDFHGSVYEYHRNTVLNANDFFNNASGVARPILIRNQFGASIGGPIKREKAFFFFNYDALRQSQTQSQTRTVFTAQARQGIFRYAQGVRNTPSLVDRSGNYIGSAPLLTYNVFENDPLRIGGDKVMAAIIAQTPLPNSFDAGGDGLNTAIFRFNAPSIGRNNAYTSKVDYNFNSSHSAFVRYTIGQFLTDGDAINTGLARYPGLQQRNQKSRRQGASVSLRSTLSPRMLNEATAGFQRSTVRFNNPQYPDALTIVSASFTDPVNPFAGSGRVAPVFEVKDSLTWISGNHTWKGGVDFRSTHFNQFRKAGTFPIYPQVRVDRTLFPVAIPNQPASTVLETNNVNTLRSMTMDLLGVWSRAQQTFFSDGTRYLPTGGQYVRGHRFREYDFFIQDDWKMTPRLTLNYGVRWEYRPAPFEVNGIMFVPDNRDFFNNPGNGIMSFSNVGKGNDARWFNNDANNFAPVVGFAWDVNGDGKTAIRSSYRVSYDRITSWIVNDSDQTTPGGSADVTFLNTGTLNTASRLANFTSTLAPPSTFTTIAPSNRSGRPVLFDPNLRTPYVQQWVLSIQRQLPGNVTFEVMYLGNKGSKLYRNFNINQLEVHSNGFLSSFLTAQNNLALATAAGASTGANFNSAISGSQPVGILTTLYGGTIPASANSDIQQGAVGTVANNRDTAANLRSAGLADNFFRPFPQFELLGLGCSCSNSTYHSLQTHVTRRYTGGLTFDASWTLSKSLDDFSGRGDGIWVVRDVRNRSLEKGPSDNDARHIVRGSAVYELPFGAGKPWGSSLSGVANQLVGGWQINGMIDAATGNPETVISGRQTLVYTPFVDGQSNVDFVGANRNFGRVTRDSQGRMVYWTDEQRSQFKFPAAGTVGTAGRNAFYGPGFWNVNFAVYKNFPVKENLRVQFRSEFFNVFNHPIMQLDSPTGLGTSPLNLSNANFGRFQTQRNDPRIIQFALRVDF